jgi:hypothetical protein
MITSIKKLSMKEEHFCPLCRARGVFLKNHKAAYCRFKTGPIACNFCGSPHKVTECTQIPKKNCSNCGKFNHTSSNCFAPRRNNNNAPHVVQDKPNGQYYGGEQYRGEQYHGEQYRGEQYHGEQYRGEQYRGEQYHGEQYRGEQYHGEQYRGEQYHGEQYQQYHGEQYYGEPNSYPPNYVSQNRRSLFHDSARYYDDTRF